ncbi:hypothetical protein RvY_04806 [Ramazzottius varieornatus]|uniref:Uncharacterized protein n=1 Tax=Ramazzottius varieornatus TaxID=947166 RepID=A0A1D1USW5_RAMVA|nr:hypothetical protein RvY_04806 [Ramazzottius varieornatus]
MAHQAGASSMMVTNHHIKDGRKVSYVGSELDEHGRLLRDRSLPCRLRKVWGTLALFQFLTAAALLITDIYAHKPIKHDNPLLKSENTDLIPFRMDLYLGIVAGAVQLIAAFVGLLPLGIPFRVYPTARYRTGHFLWSVLGLLIMVIAAVSYSIILSNISQNLSGKLGHTPEYLTAIDKDVFQRNIVFTFRILLALVAILSLGALTNLFVVIAICTAPRHCYRNCKVCSADN